MPLKKVHILVTRALDFPMTLCLSFLGTFLDPNASFDPSSEPDQIWCSNDADPQVCEPPYLLVLTGDRARRGDEKDGSRLGGV